MFHNTVQEKVTSQVNPKNVREICNDLVFTRKDTILTKKDNHPQVDSFESRSTVSCEGQIL